VSPAKARKRRARRAPSPAEAPASLLVHDLKNLASRLAALSSNLGRHYQDPLFKPAAVDVLNDTVRHLQQLAGDLRNHDSRLLIKLKINVNRVVDEALRDARPDLARSVTVERKAADLPPVWGDAYLLRRALACAIENALEAMEGDGELSVSTSMRRRNGRRSVTVEIADNGPGMSSEFLRERLFCPFSTTKEAGLGLGVYTMAQVATIHGGRVRVLSRTGRGTRVRFHLPVDD